MKTMPLRILLNSRSQMPSTPPSSKVTLVNRALGTYDCSYSLSIYSNPVLFSQTAMDNASKNAKDMIGALQMKYNRGRQAAITNELVDIITGKFQNFLFVILSSVLLYTFSNPFLRYTNLVELVCLTYLTSSLLQVPVLFERSAYIINTENRCLGRYAF